MGGNPGPNVIPIPEPISERIAVPKATDIDLYSTNIQFPLRYQYLTQSQSQSFSQSLSQYQKPWVNTFSNFSCTVPIPAIPSESVAMPTANRKVDKSKPTVKAANPLALFLFPSPPLSALQGACIATVCNFVDALTSNRRQAEEVGQGRQGEYIASRGSQGGEGGEVQGREGKHKPRKGSREAPLAGACDPDLLCSCGVGAQSRTGHSPWPWPSTHTERNWDSLSFPPTLPTAFSLLLFSCTLRISFGFYFPF